MKRKQKRLQTRKTYQSANAFAFSALEHRSMLAVTFEIEFDQPTLINTLVITGDAAADKIILKNDPILGLTLNSQDVQVGQFVAAIGVIRINAGLGADTIVLDGLDFGEGQDFEPDGIREVEIFINGGSGFVDRLQIRGTVNADEIVAGSNGINLNGDNDFDVSITGIESLRIDSFGGDDLVALNGSAGTGSAFGIPTIVNGGGGGDTIFGSTANDRLVGDQGKDFIDGEAGNDIINGGVAGDEINGGDGDDSLNGEDGNDIINGGNGNDTINGGINNDVLRGDEGNDTLGGDEGTDNLIGDNGDDTLMGGNGDDSLSGGFGQNVVDGGLGIDSVFYSTTRDPTDLVGDSFIDPDKQVLIVRVRRQTLPANVFDEKTNAVFVEKIDVGGGLGNDNINLVQLSATALAALGITSIKVDTGFGQDTVVGSGIADTIIAGEGDDTVDGGGGNDVIKGDGGNDVLRGNAGNDLINGDDGNDDIKGDSGDDILRGDAGDDVLSDANGADLLEGGDGADFLRHGNGPGVLNGGNGDDRFEAGFDTFIDQLNGNAGNDRIEASDIDRLDGGVGGVDSVVQFAVTDLTAISADRDATTNELLINISTPTVNQARAKNFEEFQVRGGTGPTNIDMSLLSLPDLQALGLSIRINGGDGGNVIKGSQGNDTISGGNGNDSINGAGGDDLIGGSGGDDTISGGAGNDRLFGQAGNDSLNGGDGDDEIRGEAGNDVLNGNAGNDRLFGGDGDDQINGNDGDDQLFGEAGNDLLDGGSGINTFDEGPGSGGVVFVGTSGDDVIRVERRVIGGISYVVAKINGQKSVQPYANGETIIVHGNSGNDKIVLESSAGQAWSAEFRGGNGDDELHGASQNDALFGELGDDSLFGEGGNDVMVGGDGDDHLFAGSGLDLAIGGAGSDRIYGGSDEDLIVTGTTVFDSENARLQLLLAEWTAGYAYETRANNIFAGTGGVLGQSGVRLRKGLTVFNDGVEDKVFGNGDRELYFFDSLDNMEDRNSDEWAN